jgi:ATP/maltotriose-dependent transcriptional regulator MalT
MGMTDEDWAALPPAERAFAVRWLELDETERDDFCRQLLAAIEVLQRLRVLDGGSESTQAV